jgi:hypothetical protein
VRRISTTAVVTGLSRGAIVVGIERPGIESRDIRTQLASSSNLVRWLEHAQVRPTSPACPRLEVGAHAFRNRFGHYMEEAAAGGEMHVRRHGRTAGHSCGSSRERPCADAQRGGRAVINE